MKILLLGDSFATDKNGWPGMIGHDITNKAQNGVGEYKIYRQIENIKNFDKVLVCHTSPWRMHTRYHPMHKNNQQRSQNDFMFNDVEYHAKTNSEMNLVYSFMKKFFDFDYQKFVYDCIVDKFLQIENAIHFTFHNKEDTIKIENNFTDIWKQYSGDINHLTMQGNEIVAEKIKKLL